MANATTAAKSPPGAVYDMATAFQSELDAGVTAANDQMLAAWAQAYQQTRQDYDALLDKIAKAKASGAPLSPAWLYQQDRLKNALTTTKAQIHQFAQQASEAARQAQAAAVMASAKAHAKMGAQAMAEAGLAGGFTKLNEANLQHLIGFLHDGTPLDALFTGLAGEAAQGARDALVRGLTLGKSPDWISRRLEQALNVPRWRAETIARTEAQRVYREVARNTYMANADVLEGWVWMAHLDRRTCPACVAMDGKVMPVGSTLDGHPRCRCAMVPRTPSWGDLTGNDSIPDSRPPIRNGQEWLKGQPPSVQRAILGPGKFKAWKDGEITLDDMVGRHNDATWGTMRHERPLSAIKAGKGANWDDAVEITPSAPVKPLADAEAVASIKATHTLDEVEATLTGMPLTGQGRANFVAAHKAMVGELPKGPSFRLPEPDPVWANKATEKMNAAVLNKGYPSKGYSQTVAIYKAKANGTVGQKVGVVKSLTWQEKVNAQQALKDHDAWLQHHLAKSLASKSEGKAIVKGLEDDLAAATDHGEVLKVHTDATMAAQFMLDDAQKARTQALLAAKYDAYLDQQAKATGGGAKSDEWVNADGDTLTIDANGWGVVKYADGNAPQNLPPNTVTAMLEDASDSWDVPAIGPNPQQVATIVNVLKDKDGYYDAPVAKVMEEGLSKPGLHTPQQAADIAEALNVAKATLPWKPEAQYVLKIKDEIKNASDPAAYVKALQEWADDPATKPLSKANIEAAVAEWKDDVAKAAEALKASAAQHGLSGPALNAYKSLSEGWGTKFTEADIKSLLENTAPASSTHKAAKALAHDKGLDHLLGDVGYVSKMELLEGGSITPAEVQEMLDYGSIPPEHAPTWKKVLKDYDAKAPKATPPTPAQVNNATGWGEPPTVSDLKPTGQTLGTHGAKVYTDPQGGRWLFKPPKDSGDGFLATLDEAASRLQARTGLKAPDTYVVTIGGKRGSLQRMFDATDAFPSGLKPDALSDADLLAVQKEQVLDWLLSNHDGHHQQFLRLPDGTLTGIDKGQAFRWMGQDRLDWDFHPNAYYGAPEPVYNGLWRAFAKGGKSEALDPRQGPLADYIKSVQGISDDEVRAMFRPYAEQAAARGRLAIRQTQPGLTPPTIPAGDVDAFLDAIVARKNALADDFAALYDKAAAERMKALPSWSPPKPKAAKPATGKAKWKDRPAPEKPEPPKAPADDPAIPKTFSTWEKKVKAKYEAYAPGKKLENSNNWARVRRVIDNRDRAAVQELLDRHYLDDDLAKMAYDLIDKADAKVAAAQAKYDKALAAYQRKADKWKRDMKAWRDANGITGGEFRGMDVGQRHSDTAGNRWGRQHWDAASTWTLAEKKHLQTYSGSAYSSINTTGRGLKDRAQDASNWGSWKSLVQGIDSAMEKSARIPEDTVLVRGTGVDSFVVDGKLLGYGDAHLIPQIVGTVQRDEAFLSSSVGRVPGYGSGQKVQMKILAPAGTKASYIDPISLNQGEREMLLPRSTSLYIHAAYEQGGRWVVEAEIVDRDFIPPLDHNGAPIVSPATERFDWP